MRDGSVGIQETCQINFALCHFTKFKSHINYLKLTVDKKFSWHHEEWYNQFRCPKIQSYLLINAENK